MNLFLSSKIIQHKGVLFVHSPKRYSTRTFITVTTENIQHGCKIITLLFLFFLVVSYFLCFVVTDAATDVVVAYTSRIVIMDKTTFLHFVIFSPLFFRQISLKFRLNKLSSNWFICSSIEAVFIPWPYRKKYIYRYKMLTFSPIFIVILDSCVYIS